MKQCVMFDMDGTLIDSMEFWCNLKYKLCENYRRRTGEAVFLTPADEKAIEKLSLNNAIKYINRHYGTKINRRMDAIKPLQEFYVTESELLPGARELLELLWADGVKMCLLTATPEVAARAALERHGILKYFRFILTPEKVKGGKFHKPIFICALQKLFCLPKNAVLIDDASYAHKTAKGVGIRCVGVNDRFRRDDLSGCDLVCDSLEELCENYKNNKRL